MTVGATTQPTPVAASRPAALLEVAGLSVDFAGRPGWVRVVEDVSFSIRERETLGLVGESGSGKSVTALSILGLLPAHSSRTAGSIRFAGDELIGRGNRALNRIRGNDIAMIFQEPKTSLNPVLTVGEQIAEQVRRHRGWSRARATKRAIEVLDLVGVPSAATRVRAYPHEFSGGMRQRLVIAMALSCEPRLLIADEPTTALDVTIQALVLELLRNLQASLGMSILFVTHDLGVVAELCDRVVVMYAGQVVEQSVAGDLFRRPRHPYTEGLLYAVPQLENAAARLWSIPGAMPLPTALPPGCRFHPRCAYVEAGRCDAEPPPLSAEADSAGHAVRCLRADELDLRGAP